MKDSGKRNRGARIISFCHGVSTSECGVAVLLPRVLHSMHRVTESYNDGRGRLLIVDIDLGSVVLKIFAVYAPTQSHAKQQIKFLEALQEKVDEFASLEGDCIIM